MSARINAMNAGLADKSWYLVLQAFVRRREPGLRSRWRTAGTDGTHPCGHSEGHQVIDRDGRNSASSTSPGRPPTSERPARIGDRGGRARREAPFRAGRRSCGAALREYDLMALAPKGSHHVDQVDRSAVPQRDDGRRPRESIPQLPGAKFRPHDQRSRLQRQMLRVHLASSSEQDQAGLIRAPETPAKFGERNGCVDLDVNRGSKGNRVRVAGCPRRSGRHRRRPGAVP